MFSFFETGSHLMQAGLPAPYIAEDDLEFVILLPLPPEC